MTAVIRNLKPSDRTQWDSLWQGYLTFYEHELTAEQTDLTWARLCDENFEMYGLVLELDGELVGLAHFSFTHSSWTVNRDLYLEDLFVSNSVRGQGLGKALILALDEIAREEGSRKVWWETHRDNQTARRLYDSVAELSEFVKYTREVD
jgi:ribosomal protein S18 acetylase RimI-like enzyme